MSILARFLFYVFMKTGNYFFNHIDMDIDREGNVKSVTFRRVK